MPRSHLTTIVAQRLVQSIYQDIERDPTFNYEIDSISMTPAGAVVNYHSTGWKDTMSMEGFVSWDYVTAFDPEGTHKGQLLLQRRSVT